MPVRNGKIYLPKPGTKSSLKYSIDFTGESFQNREDYETWMERYKEKEWECGVSGRGGLTFQEALSSETEARSRVRSLLPPGIQHKILLSVHHSQEPLESLVQKCMDSLGNKFTVGEDVYLCPQPGVHLPATITEVISSWTIKSDSDSSPNSDKENTKVEEFYAIKIVKDPKESPKVVNRVPAKHIKRKESFSSEDVENFIRGFAEKSAGGGIRALWVVTEELREKFGINNKIVSLFLAAPSPSRTPDSAKRSSLAEKKRNDSATKNPKPPQPSSSAVEEVKKSEEKEKKVKEAEKSGDSMTITLSSSSSSEDDEPVGLVVRQSTGLPPSLSSSKAQKAKKVAEKKLKQKEKSATKSRKNSSGQKSLDAFFGKSNSVISVYDLEEGSDDEDGLKLSDIKRSYVPPSPAHKFNANHCQKAIATLQRRNSKAGRVKKNLEKSLSKTPSMKKQKSQDSTGQKKLSMQRQSSGGTPGTPGVKKSGSFFTISHQEIQKRKIQGIISGLVKAWHNREKQSGRFSHQANLAVKLLTSNQLEEIPIEPLRALVKDRQEKFAEREKLKKMNDEARAEYFKDKRKHTMEKQRLQKMERNRRYEDSTLSDAQPLPSPSPLVTPDSLPNFLFGDVLMVSEFFNSFSPLFSDSDKPSFISAKNLMNAICAGEKGYGVVGKILVSLLQSLLQDELAKDYKFLGMRLAQLKVDMDNAGEIVRLCLRPKDLDDNDTVPDEDEETHSPVPHDVDGKTLRRLEENEFFDLTPAEQIAILSGLVHRLLNSYGVDEHQTSLHTELPSVTRDRNQMMLERAEKEKEWMEEDRKAEEEMRGSAPPSAPTSTHVPSAPTSTNGIPTDALDEDKEKAKKEEMEGGEEEGGSVVAGEGEEEEGMEVEEEGSPRKIKAKELKEAMRQRREGVEEEKRRKELKEKRDREFAKRDKVRNDMRLKWDAVDKKHIETVQLARNSLRLTPLGTDRNHNRYWIFTRHTPGLFVEKGWGLPNYTVTKQEQQQAEAVEEATSTHLSDILETTFPEVREEGSEWAELKGEQDLMNLIAALHPKGCRESRLRISLTARLPEIKSNLAQTEKEITLDEENMIKTSIVTGFKDALDALLYNLITGGLSVSGEVSGWTKKLEEANEISQLGELLVAVQNEVATRFLGGFMAVSQKEMKEVEDEELDSPDKEEVEVVVISKMLQQWIDAVGSCKTLAKLCVLLEMLDECVDWSKSAENAKCKVCKKKHNAYSLLLCDDCNGAYHLQCLRPVLRSIPKGDWFCPVCKPRHAPKKSRGSVDEPNSDEEEEDEEETEEEVDSEEEPPRKTRKGGAGKGKAKEERRSTRSSRRKADTSEEEEEDTPTKSRKAKVKARHAIKKTEVFEKLESDATPPATGSRSLRSGRGENVEEPENPLVKQFEEVLRKVAMTRLSTSLHTLPPPASKARSKSRSTRSPDLSTLRDSLHSFRSLKQFFDHLNHIVNRGISIYAEQGQSRKVDQLGELKAKVMKLETEYTEDK